MCCVSVMIRSRAKQRGADAFSHLERAIFAYLEVTGTLPCLRIRASSRFNALESEEERWALTASVLFQFLGVFMLSRAPLKDLSDYRFSLAA